MGYNPSYFKGKKDSPSRPVETVSWNDIAGVAGFNSKTGLRLTTEAEWEYACRGGTTTAIHSTPERPKGSNQISQLRGIAWYEDNAAQTHPVGGKAPNAFGFYDMLGNVMEWCNDYSDGAYYYRSPLTNPTGPSTSTTRILRGGCFANHWYIYCRSSSRIGYTPGYRYLTIGFRVARTA